MLNLLVHFAGDVNQNIFFVAMVLMNAFARALLRLIH